MNERIKELAKQAAARDDDCCFEWDSPYTLKFARLLILECAELCAEIDGGENMFSRAIMKRFGVDN